MDASNQNVNGTEDKMKATERIDMAALYEIVTRYSSPIAGFLYYHTGNYERALDLTDETFLRLFKTLRRNNSSPMGRPSSYCGLIFTIARKLARDDGSRRKALQKVAVEEVTKSSTSADQLQDVRAQKKELKKLVLEILQILSEDMREMLIWHEMNGLTYEEIASFLKLPLDKVKSQINRARLAFKNVYLDRENPENEPAQPPSKPAENPGNDRIQLRMRDLQNEGSHLKCAECKEFYLMVVDEDPAESLPANVAQHIDTCGFCKYEITEIRKALRAIRGAQGPSLPPLFVSFIMNLIKDDKTATVKKNPISQSEPDSWRVECIRIPVHKELHEKDKSPWQNWLAVTAGLMLFVVGLAAGSLLLPHYKGKVFLSGEWVEPKTALDSLARQSGLLSYEEGWLPPETYTKVNAGMANVDGRWITPSNLLKEKLMARGLVEYQGEWISPKSKADRELQRIMLSKGLVFHDGSWSKEKSDMGTNTAPVIRQILPSEPQKDVSGKEPLRIRETQDIQGEQKAQEESRKLQEQAKADAQKTRQEALEKQMDEKNKEIDKRMEEKKKIIEEINKRNDEMLKAQNERKRFEKPPLPKAPFVYEPAFQDLIDKTITTMQTNVLTELREAMKKPIPNHAGVQAGELSLGVLALLSSGVSPALPEIKAAMESASKYLQTCSSEKTDWYMDLYASGIYLMALEHYRKSSTDPKLDKAAKACIALICEAVKDNGKTRNPPGLLLDYSRLQYCVLGLRSASAMKMPIKASVWDTLVKTYLADLMLDATKKQMEIKIIPFEDEGGSSKALDYLVPSGYPGGWTYMLGNGDKSGYLSEAKKVGLETAAMTVAGVGALFILRDELKKQKKLTPALEKKIQEGITSGLLWLKNKPNWLKEDGYQMYGAERMCMIGRIFLMDDYDWYGDGAARICMRVPTGRGAITEDSWYLLFLKRATYSSQYDSWESYSKPATTNRSSGTANNSPPDPAAKDLRGSQNRINSTK